MTLRDVLSIWWSLKMLKMCDRLDRIAQAMVRWGSQGRKH